MRNAFSAWFLKQDPKNIIFLTADLGFRALEGIENHLNQNFVNVGISEQNMIGMSSGFAFNNFSTWCYSIAPFIYARAFEQIRNDICFHRLSVKLVANGGGFGYGVMGPSHHAIEDYGILKTLPNLIIYIPAFEEDVDTIMTAANNNLNASYIRLGLSRKPIGFKIGKYDKFRKLLHGNLGTIIVVGPIVGLYLQYFLNLEQSERMSVWSLSELIKELKDIPDQLLNEIINNDLLIVEEHVVQSSFSETMGLILMTNKIPIRKLFSFCAKHKYDKYGSQLFMLEKSEILPQQVMSKYSNDKN